MEENVRKAVIDALEPNEAVDLVKQLVDIPSPEGESWSAPGFSMTTCARPALKRSFKKSKKDEPISSPSCAAPVMARR